MEREEIKQTWEENFKEELEKELTHPTSHQNPPKINKKGVECSNQFGGRVKGEVVNLMETVLNKMNSTSRVQWLTEDEFQIVKDEQTKEKGTKTPQTGV